MTSKERQNGKGGDIKYHVRSYITIEKLGSIIEAPQLMLYYNCLEYIYIYIYIKNG